VISPADISSAGSGSVLSAPEKGGANSFVYAVFKVLYVNAKVELHAAQIRGYWLGNPVARSISNRMLARNLFAVRLEGSYEPRLLANSLVGRWAQAGVALALASQSLR